MKSKVKLSLLVDAKAATQADEILTALGMDMNDAVNLMLHQVRIKQGLPFEVKQMGGLSHLCAFCPVNVPSATVTEASANNPHAKLYKSTEEMWADLPKADLVKRKKS